LETVCRQRTIKRLSALIAKKIDGPIPSRKKNGKDGSRVRSVLQLPLSLAHI
jgi:hypothetical protein